MGFISAVLVLVMRKALKTEGDEAFGCDKTSVAVTFAVFGLAAPIIFGCLAVDAITHPAVPQAAMIDDMLNTVQR